MLCFHLHDFDDYALRIVCQKEKSQQFGLIAFLKMKKEIVQVIKYVDI